MSSEPNTTASRPHDSHPESVDSLARSLADLGLPHAVLVDEVRSAIASGDPESARQRVAERGARLLRPVINATGVILHTNLGRAPLIPTGDRDDGASTRYSNLELDMASGRRGSRLEHAARLLAHAAGAEAAVVVNNGASALLLVLATMASGSNAVVSRGELLEIGGGFRIPDVLAASGAHLVEVGTTNRTRLSDYEKAIGDGTPLILKVHQSNFTMAGFVESTSVSDLASLGCPVVVDIGSGLLDANCPWLPGGPPPWLAGEPAARQTLAAGADLVTFSGDKLLGGPQAGIVAGRRDLIERCAAHPLYRALRCGPLVLAALQRTALSYLNGDATLLPFWRMATLNPDDLRCRAEALGEGVPTPMAGLVGGGSIPGITIPSFGVRVEGDHADSLRRFVPPVIARVREAGTFLDLRTVDPSDDPVLAAAVRTCT